MKIAFAFPTNRTTLLKEVKHRLSPNNALYGYDYFQKYAKSYLCEVDEKKEKILNLLFTPLSKLFVTQTDFDIKLARAILMIPKLNKADVIISNIDSMSLAICFLKRLKIVKPPLIYSVGLFYIQGEMVKSIDERKNTLFLKFYKWLLGVSEQILYHAEIEKEKLLKLNIYNPANTTFVPMGSDDSFFKLKEKNVTRENNLIVSVGKDRARDYRTLILAAKMLPKVKFIIVCRELNLPKISIPKNVEIRKEVPYSDVKNLYHQATAIAIPIREMYRSSGQMSLTDSLQSATPVIISNVIGIRHYDLTNNKNALLVEPENVASLQAAINVLVTSKKLQREIKNNINSVAKKFSTKNYSNKLISVVEESINIPKLVPVSEKDLEYLKDIRNRNNKFFLTSTTVTIKMQRQWFKSYKERNNRGQEYMYILTDGKINYGTGAIYDIQIEKKRAKIGRFIIEEAYRGKGFGEIILKKIIYLSFEKLNLNRLDLEVLEDNKQAIKLYLKFKFKVTIKTSERGKKIILMSLYRKQGSIQS